MNVSPEFWYRAVVLLHNVLVMLDNFLCDEFGLKRRGRGLFDN